MSDFSTNLQLPYLMPAQAQKHVTVNEAVRRLDAVVQMRVQSRTTAAQPGSPGDGQMWILPPGKTGAVWDGYSEGRIAYYRDGAWEEITPRAGWLAYVADSGALDLFTGGGWALAGGASGAVLENALAAAAAVKQLDQHVKAGSTPSFNGVVFPATQAPSADPNTLDDYAEGTWTPADASGAGLSFSVPGIARYTKIGREVIARARIQYPATANGVDARIGGLPFPAGNDDGAVGGAVSYCTQSAAARFLMVKDSASGALFTAAGAGVTNAQMSGALIAIEARYSV